jgi:hypothetical protein
MRSICISFFTLTVLFVQSLYADEERRFQVDIQGLQYQAVVTENTHIASKVNGVDEELLGHHYIGQLEGEESSWVRASIIDGQWQGVVSVHNSMHIIQHVGGDIPPGAAATTNSIMESMPVTEVDGLQGTCGRGDGNDTMLDHMAQLSAINGTGEAVAAPSPLAATFAQFCSQEVNGICVIAEIEIAFDQAFQAVFGVQATAQAMSILNIVDGHYMNDLKISIDAITIEMLSNDLFSTSIAASPVLDAGVLLDDIETKKSNAQIPFITNNNALTHVVTGRDFNGGTLGVAYLGSVCEANGFSTGTSSIFFNNPATPNVPLTAVVVAHELAHNLGSDHDGPGANVLCPASTFIMSPSINPAFNLSNFSSCSATDIEETLSALATPELCMDFPADVSITENPGNSGTLNANLEFTSAYTATIINGFKAVDRINLTGTINTAQGILVAVTANGANCAIAGGGASYSCVQVSPPASFPVMATVRVNANTSDITITHNISEDTTDVQEVNSSNNVLASTFNITNNNVTSDVPAAPAAPTTPTTPTTNMNSEGDGGGAGSHGLLFILMMFGLYLHVRQRP